MTDKKNKTKVRGKGLEKIGDKEITAFHQEFEKTKGGGIKKTQEVKQKYVKKKGTVKVTHTKGDKSISITVPAEQLHFKKSKGPMLSTTNAGNRNNKRKISYNI